MPGLYCKCTSCIFSKEEIKGTVCNKIDAENFSKLVYDEANDCNHYLANTNPEDFKESINGGW